MPDIPVTGYVPPGVYTFRDPNLGTAVLIGQPRIPAFIGRTLGARTVVTDEPIVKGAIGGQDAAANSIELARKVAAVLLGAPTALLGIDYKVTNGLLDWSPNTVIGIPTNLTATPNSLGGALQGSAYSYVVTAQKPINVSGPVFGETTASVSVSATVGGSTSGSVLLSWNPVSGATQYAIYRLVGANYQRVAIVLAPTTTYLDNGTVTPNAAINPPATNNAYVQPATGATYFLTYTYRAFTYQTPQIFTSVTAVLDAHGAGSDLAIAADLALSQPPRGQGCSAVLLVAVQNFADADFLAAENALKFFLPSFVITLRSNEQLNQQTTIHCDTMSNYRTRRERTTVEAPPVTKQDGTPTADIDIRNMAKAQNFTNDNGSPAGRRVLFLSETQIQINTFLNTAGVRVTTPTTFPGYFAAAAVAARLCSLPDTATPATNKPVFNLTMLTTRDEASKDLLAQDGVCVLHDTGNGLVTIRQQLTAASKNSGAFIEDQESSIVLTDDVLAQNLRASLQKFVGQKASAVVIAGIRGVTIRVLGLMVKQELIASFDASTVEVRQSTSDPTIILIYFKYGALYPVNVISARYGFSTVAG